MAAKKAASVNEPAPIIAIPAPGIPVTWEGLSKMFTYLHLMWDDEVKPSRLFSHLAEACQEIAAGK